VAVGELPTGPEVVGVGVGVADVLGVADRLGCGVERVGVGVGEVLVRVGTGVGVNCCAGCVVVAGSGVCAAAVFGLT
jgi:hypothetical protein